MSRYWTLLTLILFLGSGGALQAEPLDSPGVVYIDGQPCNRACQSYMDWSYRALSARRHEEREISVAVPAEPDIERVKPLARPRGARQATPVTRPAPHAGNAASNGRAPGTKAPNSKQIAASKSVPPRSAKDSPVDAVAVTPNMGAREQVATRQKPEPKVEPAQAAITGPQPAGTPAPEAKPEVKSQVAAEKKPEVAVPPATLEIAPRQATPAAATPSNKSSETGKAVSASPDDPDNLVALVLAAPEINSLSDLNNRSIAITEKQSASSGRVSAALMAAGAAEVRFSEAGASAIERLINGEVPAAVVLASREVASLFPEVAGFRTFRVPLAQKARL